MIFDRGGEGQKRPYRVLKEILLERKLFLGANTKSKEKKKFAWIQSQFLFYLTILCNNPTVWNKIFKDQKILPSPPSSLSVIQLSMIERMKLFLRILFVFQISFILFELMKFRYKIQSFTISRDKYNLFLNEGQVDLIDRSFILRTHGWKDKRGS